MNYVSGFEGLKSWLKLVFGGSEIAIFIVRLSIALFIISWIVVLIII